MKCQCVDICHSTSHKNGCEKEAVKIIMLQRMVSTFTDPLHMCEDCAEFAVVRCGGFEVVCFEDGYIMEDLL